MALQVQVQLKKVVLPEIRAAGRRLFLRSFGSHTRCCSMHDNGNYSIWSKGAFGLKQGGSRSSALYAHVLPMSTLSETGRASNRPQAATVVGIRNGTRNISTATCSMSNTPHCDHIGNHKRYQKPCSMRKGVILSYNHNSSKKIFTGTSSFGLGGVTCFSTGTNTSQVRVDSSIPPMVRIFRDTETQVLNVVFTQSKEENHAPHRHEQKYSMKEFSIDHEYETHAHLVQCISDEIERHYALDDDDDDDSNDDRDFDSSENAHKQQFVGGMGESDGGVWIVTDETCEELGDALDYWELIRDIVQQVKQNRHGIPFGVFTSGLLKATTPNSPNISTELKTSIGLSTIQVSLISHAPDQYAKIKGVDMSQGQREFGQVCSFIVNATESGFPVIVGVGAGAGENESSSAIAATSELAKALGAIDVVANKK